MGAKLIYVYIGILVLAIIIGMVGLYYAFNSSISQTQKVLEQQKEDVGPAIGLYAKSKEYATLIWRRLFGGAEKIVIYRLSPENPKWVEWKRVALENQNKKGGFLDILLGTSGGSSDYAYYFQVLNASGTIIYTSPTSTIQATPTSTPPISPNNPTSTPPTPSNSTSSTTHTTSTPTSTPPTTTNPTSTATSTPPSIYYTPDGKPITSTQTTYPTDPFWVVYADAGIEIGWQNLPSSAVSISVARTPSLSTTYEELFSRGYDANSGLNYIRIVDDSFNTSWYYRLQAKNASGDITATYGPIFLNRK